MTQRVTYRPEYPKTGNFQRYFSTNARNTKFKSQVHRTDMERLESFGLIRKTITILQTRIFPTGQEISLWFYSQ